MKPLLTRLEQTIDGITMYRIMLYTLGALVVWAFALSVFGVLAYSWTALAVSLVVILASSVLTHYLCAWLTKAPANIESTLITGLILFLILTPGYETKTIIITANISIFAILSKYALAYRLRHVFNPVAVALVGAGLLGYVGVEWWVASRYMLPAVVVTGLVVLLKTNRWKLVGTYVAMSTLLAFIVFSSFATPLQTLAIHFLSWPTLFFAVFMLTEPLGMPGTTSNRYFYALIVAIVGTIPFSFGVVHGTPELALLVGNLFTLIIERPARYVLTFTGRTEVGPATYEYTFTPSYPVRHQAGQYLEWTLPHQDVDTRGIRRYLTIASAPASNAVSFAVKHVEDQSSWKQQLEHLQPGDTMYATGRAGDFVLANATYPLVCIAGGIGITPFMSMIRHAQDSDTTLPLTLFYCNNHHAERAFVPELETAREHGVHTVYVGSKETPSDRPHTETGYIDIDMIERHVANWPQAIYFISGPPAMVAAYETLLRKNYIHHSRIITDYFPGLA